jgi:hypothetical protein
LTAEQASTIFLPSEALMTYIQIPEKHSAIGFLALAKSGIPVTCFPERMYGVVDGHLQILRQKRIPFKRVSIEKVALQRHLNRLNEEI